ncbi:BtrH N-terminal domain-containing protein [Acrocarpospora sp. B8E8]|uniref:BtrH N-terminal domain-containing protein n=1 Tax=Acrocarpospora sp. B8E8 TaxID=3153572 RepID=UPI00325F64C9
MTEGKTFKRRVRERMARTGEAYTTARRHVLGAAKPPVDPAILRGYPATGGGVHHDSALLGRVLRQAGAVAPHSGEPYSEAMLAGLGGGIGFLYAIFEYTEMTTMTIVTQHHPEPFIPAALTRAGIGYEIRQTGSAKIAERHLREVLGDGRAAICRVDRHALPWHPGLPFGDGYEIAVIGLDGDTVYVDDERTTPERIPLSALETAWARHRKGKHHLLALQPGTPSSIQDAIREAIATTIAHLTGPVLNNSFDVNMGLSGMRRLVEQLGDTTGKKGWSARFATPGALFSALARLHVCLEIEYGSPGATRPIYADFLDEAAPLIDPRLTEAASLYRQSATAWSTLASTALTPLIPQLPRFAEILEEYMTLQVTQGSTAAPQLAALATESFDLATKTELLTNEERTDLFTQLADYAAQALTLEGRAITVLRD